MPFDGTNYDEGTAALRRARDLLANGWCTSARQKGDFFCALGALAVGAGERPEAGVTSAYREGYMRLYTVLTPQQIEIAYTQWFGNNPRRYLSPESVVAQFNNSQTSVTPILEWFDKAIAPQTVD